MTDEPSSPTPPDELFARPEFGRVAMFKEDDRPSFTIAMLLAALGYLVFALLEGFIDERGETKEPEIRIEQIVLGTGLREPSLLATGATPPSQYQMVHQSIRQDSERVNRMEIQDDTGNLRIDRMDTTLDAAALASSADAVADTLGQTQIRFDTKQPLSGIFKLDPRFDSVVYVIDKSGSMCGDPLNRVKAELILAIEDLAPDKRFSVVFFNSGTWPLFAKRGSAGSAGVLQVLTANPEDKQRAIDWIKQIKCGGGTVPEGAMTLALSVDPELIMLLSDGEFSPNYAKRITKTNQAKGSRKAVIDCVGLQEAVKTLKEISSHNDGTYYQATL